MRTIDKIGDYEFIGLTLNLMGESDKSRISIIGWQDGDYFEELCNENGGIDKFSLDLFKNKPTSEKIDSKETLKKKIIEFQRTPFLISKDLTFVKEFNFYKRCLLCVWAAFRSSFSISSHLSTSNICFLRSANKVLLGASI